MPITRSAKKALRQSKRKKVNNVKTAKAMKDVVKKVKQLKTKGEAKDALKTLSEAYQAIDKAAKRGIIKKGAADRKKSRLAKSLKK